MIRGLKRRLAKLKNKLKDSIFALQWVQNPSGVWHIEQWLMEAARATPADALVLDAGSGPAPYRHFFDHAHYETADHLKNPTEYFPPTYACDLGAIPVEDRRFDRIICTQVLEHVPNPSAVLKEFARVFKDDGEIWLSAPLFFEEHEGPYDFFRYTRWGFNLLATEAGLAVKEIAWIEGYYGTLAHQFAMASQSLTPSHVTKVSRWYEFLPFHVLIFLLRVQLGLLARLFTRLDIRLPDRTNGMCINYRLVLTKAH